MQHPKHLAEECHLQNYPERFQAMSGIFLICYLLHFYSKVAEVDLQELQNGQFGTTICKSNCTILSLEGTPCEQYHQRECRL